MASTASLDRTTTHRVSRSANRGFLPGMVAGAVLRAARLSAGMTEARLAITAGLPLKKHPRMGAGIVATGGGPAPRG